MEQLTPMMKQYYDIKSKFKDEILFFRMGDFYEMFGEDAESASKILDIALTKRNNIAMCGIPYHAKDNYLFKILKAGLKVAICDQLEDPSKAKGIVKRGVTEVITPGTLVEDKLLDQIGVSSHNYILTLHFSDKDANNTELSLAYCDISTGDFFAYEEYETNVFQAIVDQLSQIQPREILLSESKKENKKLVQLIQRYIGNIPLNFIPGYRFDPHQNENILLEQFQVSTLKGLGFDNKALSIGTSGALIHYLKESRLQEISHLRQIRFNDKSQHLNLNETTIKSLELIQNIQDSTSHYTLFSVLNQCQSKMGSRLLNRWILNPLLDQESILYRQSIVDFFISDENLLDDLRESLKRIMDIERLIGRVALNKINPKDLFGLKQSLIYLKDILNQISEYDLFKEEVNDLPAFDKVIENIDTMLSDDPPLDFNGEVIKPGYHSDLDSLREIRAKGKDTILEIQENEKKKLGISNLRIKYNKVIGYFLEVSKGNDKLIPEHYIRRQSLTNVTRYTLPELSEYETKILGAEDKIIEMEKDLFEELRIIVCDHLNQLKELCAFISKLDVLMAFAYLALRQNYIKPIVNEQKELLIKEGRHPVVEYFINSEEFIPNDLYLNNEDCRLQIVTGPNMAGKSTYLRQAALLVIMTQIGSFIPAESAKIPIIDKIFTRIGASDNLARGESTFLVEMIETAQILNSASENSLIIMDEIGRGTSTYDGLSIAWSIVEFLSQPDRRMGYTLFATHYHELTALAKEKGIKNYQVLVREWGDEIIFLHKVKEGSGNKSYGIQVARLAGIPDEVIKRSKEILSDLENRNFEVEDDLLSARHVKEEVQTNGEPQLDLFPLPYDQLAKEVLNINTELDPHIVLNRLEKLQDRIKKGEIK